MTHAELVEQAAKWLRRRFPVVITEMTSSGSECADAAGFGSRCSTVVECKVSRSDFFSDKNKGCHRSGRLMGDYRYYLVPDGLVRVDELPGEHGLLYATTRGVYIELEAPCRTGKDSCGEIALLVSAIRRIGGATVSGCSVKFYTYSTKDRATLGIAE